MKPDCQGEEAGGHPAAAEAAPAAARLYLARSERSRRRFRYLGLVISHKISSDRHHYYHYGDSFLDMLKLLLLNPDFVWSLEFWTLLKIVNL